MTHSSQLHSQTCITRRVSRQDLNCPESLSGTLAAVASILLSRALQRPTCAVQVPWFAVLGNHGELLLANLLPAAMTGVSWLPATLYTLSGRPLIHLPACLIVAMGCVSCAHSQRLHGCLTMSHHTHVVTSPNAPQPTSCLQIMASAGRTRTARPRWRGAPQTTSLATSHLPTRCAGLQQQTCLPCHALIQATAAKACRRDCSGFRQSAGRSLLIPDCM